MISASKINTMRNLLLLFLSLITGCQAHSEMKRCKEGEKNIKGTGCQADSKVEGCKEGWVEFTCKYPETDGTYNNMYVVPPRRHIVSNKKDVWEDRARFSLYHDTKNKKLNVTITQLQHHHSGEYQCVFQGSKSSNVTAKLQLKDGCQADFKVKGCKEGWGEFTCIYPEADGTYNNIYVYLPGRRILSFRKDVRENRSRFSLYHDTKYKKLNVTITQLNHQDSGEYQCVFQGSKSSNVTVKLELKDEENGCQEPFIQTAYRTAKTTISCGYIGNAGDKFFCKDNGSICKDILSTRSSLMSNRTFTLTESSSSLNMSISNVSSEHAGDYWCGVETNGGSYRAARRNITLKVKDTITNFTRSPTIGQNLTYWCRYSEGKLVNKFICKGEDPSICEPLVTNEQNNGRFSMKDDEENRKITITVTNVTSEDTGTYWCGAEANDTTRSNPFFHRLVITVVPPTAYLVVIIVIVCAAALLLLFVLILILIYKRYLKNRRDAAAAQLNTEGNMYEEIRVRPQEPDSGHAMNTIYVNANFPTNPSASLHYSTINFHQCSGEAGGEALTTKPRSSKCEYSTVKDSHRPTYSTVNQPSSEDPLYSTVNKPLAS